jgi:hypothetical protein
MYGAGIALALTQGNDYSNEWFLSLAKINDKVAQGEYYRLCSPLLAHSLGSDPLMVLITWPCSPR